MQSGFGILEYTILIVYVLGSVAFGLWFARSQKSLEGYFLAERSAPWWAVSISIISSDISAISYMGCAALVFTGDLTYSLGALVQPLAAIFVAYFFVPFLAKLKLFTIYQYLELRFNVGVRTVASLLFMLTRGSHLSVALYAASIALSQVLGIKILLCLLILGGLTTVYTVLGGMKAVLWTDVVQFFVLMGGLIAALFGVAMAFHWNIGQIWHIAANTPHTAVPWLGNKIDTVAHTRFLNLSPTLVQMTTLAVMLNVFTGVIGSYGSDQVLVQRYLAAGSKKEMAKSLVVGGLITLPINVIMYATGIFFVAYYYHFLGQPGYAWVGTLTDPNRVMAHFITHGIPGVLGAIVVAGLFAGTTSSFAAGLNSLSTATYIDFITRFSKKKEESAKKSIYLAKAVTLAWGIIIILGALLIGGRDTIIQILAKVMSPFSGPLLGMFLLGILFRRANSFGVTTGAIFGALATIFVTYFTKLHWLWYFIVGSMGCVAFGYAMSLLAPAQKQEEIHHLTYAGSRLLEAEAVAEEV